jgi:predicted ester cyclase
MIIEANKAVVRRYYEDAPFNPAACDEIFAPHFLFHTIQHASVTAQAVESDPASEKKAYEQLSAIWGGWHVRIVEMIAEGDRVMVWWETCATHQGELHGLPPTYREITWSGINIFRLENGKIAEVWDIMDRLWMWQQLGVLPDLKDAIARKTHPESGKM